VLESCSVGRFFLGLGLRAIGSGAWVMRVEEEDWGVGGGGR